jgi:hypothetical protein
MNHTMYTNDKKHIDIRSKALEGANAIGTKIK